MRKEGLFLCLILVAGLAVNAMTGRCVYLRGKEDGRNDIIQKENPRDLFAEEELRWVTHSHVLDGPADYRTGVLCELYDIGPNEVGYCGYIDMRGVYAIGIQILTDNPQAKDEMYLRFECTAEDDDTEPARCAYTDVTEQVRGFPEITDRNLYLMFMGSALPMPARYCRLKYLAYGDVGDQTLVVFYTTLGPPAGVWR